MRFALRLTLVVLPMPAAGGTIGNDDRLSVAGYARQRGEDLVTVRRRFGDSGRIVTASCGRFDARSCFSFSGGIGPDLKAAVEGLEARP